MVATSANDPHNPRLARYDGAFDAYLSKPCDLDRLEELLTSGSSRVDESEALATDSPSANETSWKR